VAEVAEIEQSSLVNLMINCIQLAHTKKTYTSYSTNRWWSYCTTSWYAAWDTNISDCKSMFFIWLVSQSQLVN